MEILKRSLRLLPIDEVRPWADNPKARIASNRQFRELVEHIRSNGQLDPIDVAATEDHPYQIVRGHRRYEAIHTALHWPFIEAWVWFEPFREVLVRLLPTERMQRSWAGKDKGQATVSMGVDAVQGLYRDEDVLILQWAATELATDAEVFRWLCARFGPRVFAKAHAVVCEDWPLLRICRAIQKNKHYRDIEAKGLPVEERRAILSQWEQKAV